MTFIHPLLLGGLALVAVPVLLHLIVRQQPKRLPFPAFRFLKQRARTNQRKVRLRHLLLLLLRMLLIAALCLALARPRIFSERFHLSGEQPVAAVLIVDTSPSMGYTVGDRSRLDDARRRALELLDTLPDGGKVAVLDTAEPGGEWSLTTAAARERLNGLNVRAGNGPVTEAVAAAYRLFQGLDGGETDGAKPGEALPRLLYVFSDRTAACWDAGRLGDLQGQRDRIPPPAVQAVFVDVGVDQPRNLAVTGVEMPAQAVPANRPVVFRVSLQATAADADFVFDTELGLRVLGRNEPEEKKPVQVRAGQGQVVEFRREGLPPGFYQAEFRLPQQSPDPLPFDNVRFVTFEVREPRRVLVLTDHPEPRAPKGVEPTAEEWRRALESARQFACDVRPADDATLDRLTPETLRNYRAVCLLSVAQPGRKSLWEKLRLYVEGGGNLVVLPGGDELTLDQYQSGDARKVLPASLKEWVMISEGEGVSWAWDRIDFRHPLLAPFKRWAQLPGVASHVTVPGHARCYWSVAEGFAAGDVLARYADKEKTAALLERATDRKKGEGRVLLFTTPMDDRRDASDPNRGCNDYLQGTRFQFYALAVRCMSYLVGDDEPINFNYLTGQAVPVPLPPAPRFPSYELRGPGLTGTSDALVQRGEGEGELRLTPMQTATAGNFRVVGGKSGKEEWSAYFSVNPSSAESQLERVPVDAVEALFGPDSILPAGKDRPLRELLQGRFSQPLELLPWLMLALLILLALENLLANKFYRRPPPKPAG